jgi:predicted Zn-dependent protease
MTGRDEGAELDLARRVVELVRGAAGPGAEVEVFAHHAATALTRFANSAIHQNVADATTTVRLRLHLDGRTTTGASTVTGTDGLRALVERTVAAVRVCPRDAGWPGVTPPAAAAAPGRFDEATARATPDERAGRVLDFVRAAGGLETAGYCRTTYSSAAFANSAGQAVEGRTAEAAMDGIARTGGADGVARLAVDRLADLDGAVLGARAAAKARAGTRPVELPPGHYEVVLEPDAVADILQNLAFFGFNGKAFAERRSFAEPGAQQFDPAITLVDEPLAGPTGGALVLPFDAEGTPRSALTLVRDGTTLAVTHDRRSAAEAGAAPTGHAVAGARAFGPMPTSLRLAAGPPGSATGGGTAGGGTAGGGTGPIAGSAAGLISGVERGLLVTDLWYTRVLDPKSLVVTGLTRNGVWMIEDGEITSAVGNLRFTQSYPQALAPGAVRGIGSSTALLPDRWATAWYAAPAVHLASWHFTGNASG